MRWNSGYVSDIPYVEAFNQYQSPAHIALACLFADTEAEDPGSDDPVHYLELGCGMGMNALLIAAANPRWQVTAIDFNPGQIATGLSIARAAGITNLRLLEADITTLAGSPLGATIPAADYVAVHGMWSWVAPPVRAGIVRLLADKVQPGGAVFLSFNALPAWQGGIGLQRLLYEAGSRAGGRSDRQAEAGLRAVQEMRGAGGFLHLNENRHIEAILRHATAMPLEYVSHEYMNQCWAPSFHADVCAALADAKLSFVAPVSPVEQIPELMLTAAQRAIHDRYDDPIMRELIKDSCINRPFRQDIFVRGPRRISAAAREAALSQLHILPAIPEAEMKTALAAPVGLAQLGEPLLRRLTLALRGQHRIAGLLAADPVPTTASELLCMLIGTAQVQLAPRPNAAQTPQATRLNQILAARTPPSPGPAVTRIPMAATRTGGGASMPATARFVASRLLAGETADHLDSWVTILAAGHPPEYALELRGGLERGLTDWVPVLRAQGVLPG